ncbi:hypothetical protein [Burkholderia phage FLC8]|nr:hypothetical protein [Burkholderia phage FLC8]
MGSSEITPPVLEAVKPGKDGLIQHRTLGFKGVAVYPTQVQPGWLLEVEQLVLAREPMSKLLIDEIEARAMRPGDEEFGTALMETSANIMAKLSQISYFNANAMFTGSHIPKRMAYEGLQVLDYLVSMVITQRDRIVYHTDEEAPADWPIKMFNTIELDRIIGSIHQAELHGLYQDPAHLVKFYHLLDETFFRQCAMAFSMATGVSIPRGYTEDKPSKVFHWATKVLMQTKESIPDLKVRPKPQNVVNLFKTK